MIKCYLKVFYIRQLKRHIGQVRQEVPAGSGRGNRKDLHYNRITLVAALRLD